jgi:cysteinyl-tRNA synthetase
MSKSEGNFYTVRDLLKKGYSGLEIRFALLSTHYRSSANFTFQGLEAARTTLRSFREFRRNMTSLPERPPPAGEIEGLQALREKADQAFRQGLDDDLNISVALREVHGFLGEANKRCTTRPSGLEDRLRQFMESQGVVIKDGPQGTRWHRRD